LTTPSAAAALRAWSSETGEESSATIDETRCNFAMKISTPAGPQPRLSQRAAFGIRSRSISPTSQLTWGEPETRG
jgi:hypothetical protein